MQVDTRQVDFLQAYSELGTISAACLRSGSARTTVYNWLAHDADFANAYLEANRAYGDVIRDAIHNRSIEGSPQPVIYRGQPVLDAHGNPVIERHFSDNLLIFMARAHLPEYKNQDDTQTFQTNYSLLIPDIRQLSQSVLDDLIRDLERIQQTTVEADQ